MEVCYGNCRQMHIGTNKHKQVAATGKLVVHTYILRSRPEEVAKRLHASTTAYLQDYVCS